MKDDAKDVTGETFPNVYTGTPALISDVPEYVTDQQDQRAATGKTAYPVRHEPCFTSKLKHIATDRKRLVLELQALCIHFRWDVWRREQGILFRYW